MRFELSIEMQNFLLTPHTAHWAMPPILKLAPHTFCLQMQMCHVTFNFQILIYFYLKKKKPFNFDVKNTTKYLKIKKFNIFRRFFHGLFYLYTMLKTDNKIF